MDEHVVYSAIAVLIAMARQAFLNQTRFPRLWKAFQTVAGFLHDKRALCLLKYQGQPAVLEVGCSVGTIASVFARSGSRLHRSRYRQLVVVEPVLPEPGDPAFFRLFLRLEQGRFVRATQVLEGLLGDVPRLTLVTSETHVVGASPWSVPRCARFGVYVLQRSLGAEEPIRYRVLKIVGMAQADALAAPTRCAPRCDWQVAS